MRKLAGNDIIEMWSAVRGTMDEMPHVMHVDRQALDQRAKMLAEFCKLWGHAAAFSDAMGEAHDQPHSKTKQYNVQDVVTRAAEMVEAIWFEGQRRGWIIDLPPFDETL